MSTQSPELRQTEESQNKDQTAMQFLRDGPTAQLLAILGELFDTGPTMSPLYFALALDPRFKGSTRAAMFDRLTTVLRERLL